MEAHGVATPEEFSRADPPFDVILDEMAGYLGVAGAAAGRLTCRAWCTALGRTRTMAQLVQREATAGGAPPLGFAELARNDGAHHAWRLARAALRRRKLVVGGAGPPKPCVRCGPFVTLEREILRTATGGRARSFCS